MKFKLTALTICCIVIHGCVHDKKRTLSPHEITLEMIEDIPLGSTQDEVERKIGTPTQVFVQSPKITEWFYSDGDYNRVVFDIDPSSRKIIFKFWDVREGDPERKLEVALARYPNAKFKVHESTLPPFHGEPGYLWYEDANSRVSILFRKKLNVVDSIVWGKRD